MNTTSFESPPPVLHTRDERGVHTLLLNRASTFNALSHDMLAALQAALEAGGPVEVKVQSLAADSLGARNVGPLVHAVSAATVDHVVLVPDAAITQAQTVLWRDFRLASEPGGAAALAALLCGAYVPAPAERVGVLCCGANVDLTKLDALMA